MKRGGYLALAAAGLAMITTAAWLARTVPLDDVAPTDRYDRYFKKYNKRYFSVLFDWRWFKAQSMAESSLDSDARGPRGAVGVMQILPDTFEEVIEHYPSLHDIANPKWNIAAGVAFNRYLFDRWTERVSEEHSLKFTFASYNAGFPRMLRVKKRADAAGGDSNHWAAVAPFAPAQTRRYVRRIHELMGYESKAGKLESP